MKSIRCRLDCATWCEYFKSGECTSSVKCKYQTEHISVKFPEAIFFPTEEAWEKLQAENSRLTAERNDSKIEYRGYHTYVRYSVADKVLYGKIEDIKDLVNFESESATEIENEFHKAVDDYIAFCREVGKNVEEEKRE